MNKFVFFLLFIVLLVVSPVAADAHPVVTISAGDVVSAADIEAAIEQATASGSRPGTVMLDAAGGPFTYTDLDRTINIAYPDLKLRGQGGPVIGNCADGILFENTAAHNVLIEGITFQCENSGILAPNGLHDGVTIRHNTISAVGFGMQVVGGDGWRIINNQVQAGVEAVSLIGLTGSVVRANDLAGADSAVALDGTTGVRISGNRLTGASQGIYLAYGTGDNNLISNTILGTSHTGVELAGENSGNAIHGNTIYCAGMSCSAVCGPLGVYGANKISGNKVR